MNLIEFHPAPQPKRFGTDLRSHEGTNHVKETKINMLVHKYELFKMEPIESIAGMYTRFIDIVNNLKNLDKVYTKADLCRKILRSLFQT